MVLTQQATRKIPYTSDPEENEKFLTVVGAVVTRTISVAKACEILSLEQDRFFSLLDQMGVDYSYLDEDDLALEMNL